MPNSATDARLLDLVERRDWGEIRSLVSSLPRSGLKILADELWRVVPKREYGHGLETFVEAIEQYEARDASEADLVWLWKTVQIAADFRNIHTQGPKVHASSTNPFKGPVSSALELIESGGLTYQGWDTTYVWRHRDTGEWHQADRYEFEKWKRALDDGLESSSSRLPDICVDGPEQEAEVRANFAASGVPLPNIVRMDISKDEEENWVAARSLRHHFQVGTFQANSPFWHALNILSWYNEVYLKEWDWLVKEQSYSVCQRADVAQSIHMIADAAIEVGRSHEALAKKRFEKAAITGLKIQRSLKVAGAVTNAQHGELRRQRFVLMQQLAPSIGVEAAARRCEKAGLGNSATIKRQWNRWKEKRDT